MNNTKTRYRNILCNIFQIKNKYEDVAAMRLRIQSNREKASMARIDPGVHT